MKLITVFFARSKGFKNFLTVWEKSAQKTMPNIPREIIRPKVKKCIDHKRDTAIAFIAAAEYALKSNEELLITDVDMMFQNRIDTVLRYKFDIAVTVRNYKAKYNTGLWIYRPTEKAKLFLKHWLYNTNWIVKNFDKCTALIGKHGGIDQASLWMTVERLKKENINILELPCQTWNACQTEWQNVNSKTKIIHVKSKLRLVCTGRNEIPADMKYLKPLMQKWRSYL